MKMEGIGPPLYQENLLIASEAAKYLLPEEVVSNLTKGTSIVTNSDRDGELKPYFYGDDFVSAVAGYVIGEDTLYGSEQFRYNALKYLQTFGLPEDLYVFSGKPIQSHKVPIHRRQIASPNFYTVDTIPEHGRKDRIFMHGRFNGFPHPPNLETLINLRIDYPDAEVWCGIDTYASSIKKGQKPFVDPFFRASALRATGLIHHFLLLDPPEGNTQEDIMAYWDNLYVPAGGSLDPDKIVIADDDLFRKKILPTRSHQSIYFPLVFQTVGDIHQTDLKNGTYPIDGLKDDWLNIQKLLRNLHSLKHKKSDLNHQ